MNKEELIGKLQMVYIGDRNALNEMVGYYDGLKENFEHLTQQNKKQKEVINKAIDWLVKYQTEWCQEDEVIRDLKKVLDILKEEDKEALFVN